MLDNMEHSYFKDRISAYHDSELKHEEWQAIDDHLKECAECRQLLEEFKRLDAMIEQRSELAGDEYFEQAAQKIEQRLGGETETTVTDVEPSTYKGLWWKVAATAASVAIIAFIALYETDITREARQAVEDKSISVVTADFDSQPEPAELTSAQEEFAPVAEKPKAAAPAETKADESDELVQVKTMPETSEFGAVIEDLDSAPSPERLRPEHEVSQPISESKDTEAPEIATRSLAENNLVAVDKTTAKDVEIKESDSVTEVNVSMTPRPTDLGVEITVKGEQDRVKAHAPSNIVIDRDSDRVVRGGKAEEVAVVTGDVTEEPPPPIERLQFESDESLYYWQQQRDSLSTLLARLEAGDRETKTSTTIRSAATAAAKEKTAESVVSEQVDDAAPESADKKLNRTEIIARLLECHFMVADMTFDDDEFEASIAVLEHYAASDDPEIKAIAAVYLTQFELNE